MLGLKFNYFWKFCHHLYSCHYYINIKIGEYLKIIVVILKNIDTIDFFKALLFRILSKFQIK